MPQKASEKGLTLHCLNYQSRLSLCRVRYTDNKRKQTSFSLGTFSQVEKFRQVNGLVQYDEYMDKSKTSILWDYRGRAAKPNWEIRNGHEDKVRHPCR